MPIIGVIFSLLLLSALRLVPSFSWPYLQIYPAVNSSDDRTPLYFALELSTSGHFPSISALPGIQIALDYINNEPSLLPGYSLHYTLTDSKCHSMEASNTFFRQILTEPTKLAWIGSGCSVATESTAELTPFYNLTQVSCVSSLTENEKYTSRRRYYFQTLPSLDVVAHGFLSLIFHFQWKKVHILTWNQRIYINLANTLKEDLTVHEVEHAETIFTHVSDIRESTYVSGERIFVWLVDEHHANKLACEAHSHGLRYPKYQFLLPGWFPEGFLQDFTALQTGCNETQRTKTLEYSLTVSIEEFDNENIDTGIGGYTSSEFQSQVEVKIRDSTNGQFYLSNATLSSPELCYEATLSIALALHNTLMDLESNDSLSREAALEAGLTEGDGFSLENFSYSNFAILQRMFYHLSNTDFNGINARPVSFNQNGRRFVDKLKVSQYQIKGQDILHEVQIGHVENASTNNSILQILESMYIWPNGTPTDGLPIVKVVTVWTSNVVVFSLLGVIGIIYSLAYIIFNYIHRNKKIIRLSSPNLNYLIGCGAILLYSTLFFIIVRDARGTSLLITYHISTWIVNLGYTLFFGTISSKMMRIWYIFNNPAPNKKLAIKDYHLVIVIIIFIAFDLLILGGFAVIEGARGNLRLSLTRDAEEPRKQIGPTAEVHEFYFYGTFELSVLVWYAVLSVQKGIIGNIALFLAFRTRKVKMRGLDDSKFVIAATYATNIFTITGSAASLSAYGGFFNVFIALFGGNLFVSTTTVLSLIFVPKIMALYKDPSGEDIGGMVMVQKSVAAVTIEPPTTVDTTSEKRGLRQQIERLETQLAQHTERTGVRLKDIIENTEL